jgi:hypothetical protein
LVAAVLSTTIVGETLHAQDLPYIFARLTDASGMPATDLTPEDISVIEDGVERMTVMVEPVDWPVKLTLLVDNTRAMAQGLGVVREGLKVLINSLPEEISIELLTLAPQPRRVVRRTNDRAELLEGIDLIAPDNGAGAFIDGLVETSDRIRDDDDPHFPVVVMVATNGPDPAQRGGGDRKVQRLFNQTVEKPATYHVIVLSGSGQSATRVTGAVQTQVGTEITGLTSGRYEFINNASRLATLLPEFGEQIAASHERQTTQYRVVYMRPADADPPTEGIRLRYNPSLVLDTITFDGRMP